VGGGGGDGVPNRAGHMEGGRPPLGWDPLSRGTVRGLQCTTATPAHLSCLHGTNAEGSSSHKLLGGAGVRSQIANTHEGVHQLLGARQQRNLPATAPTRDRVQVRSGRVAWRYFQND
jgi:hypothetical protein